MTGNLSQKTLADEIRWAVIEECCAHKDGEPHAMEWNRDGYRRVATLCERCARLIGTLQALISARDAQVIREAAERLQFLRPEMGMHVNVSEYRRGKDDALILAQATLRAEAESASLPNGGGE